MKPCVVSCAATSARPSNPAPGMSFVAVPADFRRSPQAAAAVTAAAIAPADVPPTLLNRNSRARASTAFG